MKGINFGDVMTKEEVKQWLRNLIDSSVKKQDEHDKNKFLLYYNKSYVRALKFSKITGQPVNEKNFKGGELLFSFNVVIKIFWHCDMIEDYLNENYSTNFYEQKKLLDEVINEYEEYKDYNVR